MPPDWLFRYAPLIAPAVLFGVPWLLAERWARRRTAVPAEYAADPRAAEAYRSGAQSAARAGARQARRYFLVFFALGLLIVWLRSRGR